MKAIVRKGFGGPETLKVQTIPTPKPKLGEVLIQVMAFGLNRAEIYMREGSWGEVAAVSGIECVGLIKEDPSNTYEEGQCVCAIMGGMGRSINGSYAEYVCLPIQNTIPIHTKLAWKTLAALPESYATAWSCLYDNMKIKAGDTILIRAGTSSLGQAAINIASHIENTHIIGTTRNPSKESFLKKLGCHTVFLENGALNPHILGAFSSGIDGVLDIVGNSTLKDSLKMVKKGGNVCIAGFLGGGDSISFNPLEDMPSSVNLSFFASFMFGTLNFPLANIPIQEIIHKVESGNYTADPAHVFNFEDIQKAHKLMESGEAQGKIVIMVAPQK